MNSGASRWEYCELVKTPLSLIGVAWPPSDAGARGRLGRECPMGMKSVSDLWAEI